MATSNTTKKTPGISYWSKDKCICPVCKKSFEKEIMRSGNGRMIAGGLSDELHRTFEPSAKYGVIYPLIYEIGACPHCYSAFFWNDFKDIKGNDVIDKLFRDIDKRREAVENIFPYFDLKNERKLFDGAAMYYLALLSYECVGPELIPTLKKAIISLRLAWLCTYIDKRCSGYNYDYIAQVFYRKSLFFYQQAVINETTRSEKSSTLSNMGPDMDKNYGWDGVIYLCGLLEYKYGQREDTQLRLKKLSESKTAIARIFGLGKSSKNKPGPLLEHARELYDNLSKELKDDDF
jgi:uncharacterized protein (DUF2225 family)